MDTGLAARVSQQWLPPPKPPQMEEEQEELSSVAIEPEFDCPALRKCKTEEEKVLLIKNLRETRAYMQARGDWNLYRLRGRLHTFSREEKMALVRSMY